MLLYNSIWGGGSLSHGFQAKKMWNSTGWFCPSPPSPSRGVGIINRCGLCVFMKFLNPFTTNYLFHLHVLLLVCGLSIIMCNTHSLGTFRTLPTMLLGLWSVNLNSPNASGGKSNAYQRWDAAMLMMLMKYNRFLLASLSLSQNGSSMGFTTYFMVVFIWRKGVTWPPKIVTICSVRGGCGAHSGRVAGRGRQGNSQWMRCN